VVATLPLLATFLDEPFEPSPYAPVSRLFWNEFYLDITRIPELQKCPSVQAYLNSTDSNRETDIIRSSRYVEYRREMAVKRQILEEFCQSLFDEDSNRLKALNKFLRENPLVEEYARFRATLEKRRTSWRAWPQRLRQGSLREGDYNERDKQYHLYVQWLAHQQVETLNQKAREKDVSLYLDLPLGVHPDGFDAWHEQSLFDLDVSVGAPPDVVFTAGQDWNFSPPHPDRIREQGYKYTIAYLRHHLQYADILRIDHVMGFHRFYCIPKSLSSEQGVYLRYRSEELYAILALESHRYGNIIVGEDLGTVPREVRQTMSLHGLHRMYVMHYELQGDPRKALRPVSTNYVASLNNHDMPTFTAFWHGLDIKLRLELGFINKTRARREQNNREKVKKALVTFLKNKGWLSEPTSDSYAVMRACLSFLSATKAYATLVNLEDLWMEKQPQNVPSSGERYPNWRRKAQYGLDEFCQMPQVLDILQEINSLRKLDTFSPQPMKEGNPNKPKFSDKT
jgi:4-alpha-glucanotransferase